MTQTELQTRIDRYVTAAKAEITQYAAADARFYNAQSFAELHDYCDANMLGGTDELYNEFTAAMGDEAGLDATRLIMDPGMDILDAWISAGGHRTTPPTCPACHGELTEERKQIAIDEQTPLCSICGMVVYPCPVCRMYPHEHDDEKCRKEYEGEV